MIRLERFMVALDSLSGIRGVADHVVDEQIRRADRIDDQRFDVMVELADLVGQRVGERAAAYLDGTLIQVLRNRIELELIDELSRLKPEESAVLAFLKKRLGEVKED